MCAALSEVAWVVGFNDSKSRETIPSDGLPVLTAPAQGSSVNTSAACSVVAFISAAICFSGFMLDNLVFASATLVVAFETSIA